MSNQVKQLLKVMTPSEKHWVGDGFYVSSIFSMHSENYSNINPFLLLDHHFYQLSQKALCLLTEL